MDYFELADGLLRFQAGGSAPGQSIEAVAHLHFYGRNGYWRLEAVGFADTEEEAGAAAKLMLGRASAAIGVAVSVPHRISETEESGGDD